MRGRSRRRSGRRGTGRKGYPGKGSPKNRRGHGRSKRIPKYGISRGGYRL